MTDRDFFKRRETYFHIGNAYYFFRDYPRAVEYFRVAMQDGERLFFDRSGLRAKEKMAQYYASVNQLDSSDCYYRALYNSPEHVRFRPDYDIIAIQGLAGNCIKRGEYHKALALLQKIHPELLKAKKSGNITTNMYLLAICYIETGRLNLSKSMMDSTKVMLMKSKEQSRKYPKTGKEIDFLLKNWYDLMNRYNKITGNRELEYAYRDSVYIIDKEESEEKNTLVILRAEQELFETQKRLANEQIRIRNYQIAIVSTAFSLVSEAINTVCKCNFNTFINDYRIKFAVTILSNSDYDKYSLEQIAEISGFSNRQSFYTSFKNKTGLTPAAFCKNRNPQ
ncbi:MAG: helix-turn-helix domain-containing protein [Dysgonamonadaceae bacterium]|nr:helix-turn-helix domain-containing protein [Dysgonamonadaceae bacterium]